MIGRDLRMDPAPTREGVALMKTVLAILAAIVLPGGFIVLAAGALTYLLARDRVRAKPDQPAPLG